MKRKNVVFGVVLSVFVLLSTSVLANTVQTEINESGRGALKTDESDLDVFPFIKFLYFYNKNNFHMMLEDAQDDCGCHSDNLDEKELNGLRLWHFPIICTLLYSIIIFCEIMFAFTHGQIFFDLAFFFYKLGEDLGCRWVPDLNFYL
jgi:hypothetical protein